ncbi:MAG: dihydropteroate synthase [Chloroflexota bacterium]|nr:dihydropteroate synthase [Chloroflexota bacterium]
MLVVGEAINATNKSVGQAIAQRNKEFLQKLARDQAEAGADYIDVNAGAGNGSMGDAAVAMEWLVEIVQEATDKPLAIDSDSPEILKVALDKYRGNNLLINSVNAEPDRLIPIATLAAERDASLVALAMGSEGIPDNVNDRLSACDMIMRQVGRLGVKADRIYFDPLVLPISVDPNQGMITLNTLREVKAHYPTAKTIMGLSNISYGLPGRGLINRAFLLMAAQAGLDSAILNPLDTKAMTFIKVANMLTGNDPFCKTYIKAYRKGTLIE